MAGFFRGTFKRHFNFSQWIGLKFIFSSFRVIPNIINGIANPPKAEYSESFEQAVVRLGLKKEDLNRRLKEYFWTSVLYLVLGLACFFYAASFIPAGLFNGFLMATIVGFIFIAHAFRSHFWYAQISKKRLGMTISEWVCFLFGI